MNGRGIFEGADDNRSVLVKLKGERGLLLEIKRHLEERFIAIPTSQLRPNDRDPGVHIFIVIVGRREEA
ncbi:MAG: hypothetical protein DRI26_00775 [Chloroflexi bacterium]|nr:MAG: hypothetical protein DRI26_00775 [Chloroflexota bacterium]